MAASRLTTGRRAWLTVPLLVGGGALVGANLRHGLSGLLAGPAGTLAANVLGSLLLGLLLAESGLAGRLPREVRLVVGTGLLSSFTTYSTFVLDAVTASPAVAVAYVAASYGLGLGGVLVGLRLADLLAGVGS